MKEQKASAEMVGTPRVEARVSRAERFYEAKEDYDALLREYQRVSTTAGPHEKPAEVLRAELDVEVAKDLSASILAFRNATASEAAKANALTKVLIWLTVGLIFLTVVLAALTGVLAYDVVRRLTGN